MYLRITKLFKFRFYRILISNPSLVNKPISSSKTSGKVKNKFFKLKYSTRHNKLVYQKFWNYFIRTIKINFYKILIQILIPIF